MSSKINYKIIDNLPQKNMKDIDIIKINQIIEGYDTVQNTLDNIDSTNKYNLEIFQEQVPIFIKSNYNNNNKTNSYISLIDHVDNNKETHPQETDISIKKTSSNNNNNSNKMNAFTTFYVGSLTIIGLFIFHRLIQKTK